MAVPPLLIVADAKGMRLFAALHNTPPARVLALLSDPP
jgi:hypothetical protein